jgi:histone H3/H4
MSSADVYRKRATECQRQADAAVTQSVRETLSELADKYLELATKAERSTLTSRADRKGSSMSPKARR